MKHKKVNHINTDKYFRNMTKLNYSFVNNLFNFRRIGNYL